MPGRTNQTCQSLRKELSSGQSLYLYFMGNSFTSDIVPQNIFQKILNCRKLRLDTVQNSNMTIEDKGLHSAG